MRVRLHCWMAKSLGIIGYGNIPAEEWRGSGEALRHENKHLPSQEKQRQRCKNLTLHLFHCPLTPEAEGFY